MLKLNHFLINDYLPNDLKEAQVDRNFLLNVSVLINIKIIYNFDKQKWDELWKIIQSLENYKEDIKKHNQAELKIDNDILTKIISFKSTRSKNIFKYRKNIQKN